jgi:hypothetical protein
VHVITDMKHPDIKREKVLSKVDVVVPFAIGRECEERLDIAYARALIGRGNNTPCTRLGDT